jgi:hypothetical protein
MQEFQLVVKHLDNNNFALELYQCRYKKAGAKERSPAQLVGRVHGSTLSLIRQDIYDILRINSYDPATLSHKRRVPYILSEESGVNLAVLFQTIQPLKKLDIIAEVAAGIMAMSNEEIHYWFAKITNGNRSQTLKAMRVLLSN